MLCNTMQGGRDMIHKYGMTLWCCMMQYWVVWWCFLMYGEVWCRIKYVWNELVWSCMIYYAVVWIVNGAIRFSMVRNEEVWYKMMQIDAEWLSMVANDSVPHGMMQYGSEWCSNVPYDLICMIQYGGIWCCMVRSVKVTLYVVCGVSRRLFSQIKTSEKKFIALENRYKKSQYSTETDHAGEREREKHKHSQTMYSGTMHT